jgi:hypothetical protein
VKKIITPDILAKEYVEYATIEGETKLSGDYKLGNKMSNKLQKIFLMLRENQQLSEEVIKIIMCSNSARARSMASVDALRLNIFIDDAIKILEKESQRQDILGFSAEMALKIYRGEIPGKTL